MKFKCYDTCSLLEQAGYLFSSNDESTLVITSITFDELEHIKTAYNKDANVKNSARRILRDLDEYYGELITFFSGYYGGALWQYI